MCRPPRSRCAPQVVAANPARPSGTVEPAGWRVIVLSADTRARRALAISQARSGSIWLDRSPGAGRETCPVTATRIAPWWPWDLPGLATTGRCSSGQRAPSP